MMYWLGLSKFVEIIVQKAAESSCSNGVVTVEPVAVGWMIARHYLRWRSLTVLIITSSCSTISIGDLWTRFRLIIAVFMEGLETDEFVDRRHSFAVSRTSGLVSRQSVCPTFAKLWEDLAFCLFSHGRDSHCTFDSIIAFFAFPVQESRDLHCKCETRLCNRIPYTHSLEIYLRRCYLSINEKKKPVASMFIYS